MWGMVMKLDWNEYIKNARNIVGEGCVLLENNNDALPLVKGSKVSVFGRIQLHYYKSGTGSGGMVNVSKVYGIIDGLTENGDVLINKELLDIYTKWEEENPFNEGIGWGTEPWSQTEMPLSDETVNSAAAFSDTAIVVIGRTAGEDQDFSDAKGAYKLSDTEEQMIEKVRKAFKKVIVLLNVGSLMDLNFIDRYSPDAVMVIWQGGMIGGLGTADVLLGKVNPSGKLPDTVVYNIDDYPSSGHFGDKNLNYYVEDIYVGYRYFSTFAKDKVRYPFGYGLSYTRFEYSKVDCAVDMDARLLKMTVLVKNVGAVSGKDVVEIYVSPPNGKLGKPYLALIDFKKTSVIKPGGEETVDFEIPFNRMASFDDKGETGYKYAFVMEDGIYKIFAGSDSLNVTQYYEFSLDKCMLIKQLSDALGPVREFKRLSRKGEDGGMVYEDTPIYTVDEKSRRLQNLPHDLVQTGENSYTLDMVRDGRISMQQFIACLSDEDLACIVRGEGMGSSLVTPGTASAFAGVSKSLRSKNIPAVCTDDGPSGMRLDSGVKAFSLPNGTMIASTFNPQAVTQLYELLGLEMIHNRVDVLLGPGMNIHRHPLNGRNFEYFSEDPLLTGIMGAAVLKGLKKNGLSGTVKHFCGNNQEFGRHETDAVVSERALREIYLKGFEIAVESGYCDSVMTTYGQVNGRWTAGNYDLCTRILRDEWGFEGIVMTDWWARVNERNNPPSQNNTAEMVRAQNDLYMVVADAENNSADDNTLAELASGRLTRGELQRCAANICNFAMNSVAMKRLVNEETDITIVGRDDEVEEFDGSNVEYIKLDGSLSISLTDKESKGGTNYYFPLDIVNLGRYEITLTGSSSLSELAQIPCTLYYTGVPWLTFTFNGTGGNNVSIAKDMQFGNRMAVFRLNVAKNGVKLDSIKFEFKDADNSN